ncbi:MAG TPA: GspH/FimT family pseudopilin [Candidatus Sulfotelmatobacter sp.]|nr:GspH/FimT family pseudopilin [Candidatus Sulfotelmatobacter sp.]
MPIVSITFSQSMQKAFTLIELLVVFSLIGLLTALGIASYSSYNATQSVQSSANDLATFLQTAESRSISQVVPSSCSNPVTGYEVDVTPNGKQYTLFAVCGLKQVITTNQLPSNVSFTGASDPSVVFAISSGVVITPKITPATISIAGYGKSKTIRVSGTGIVAIN